MEAIAWAGHAQWLLVAWAYWVDRHRTLSVATLRRRRRCPRDPGSPILSSALLLGPAACLGSAALWALSANVYSRAARVSSPMAVNFMRASLSFPFFLVAALAMGPEGGLAQVTAGRAGWLLVSVVGSYVVGDALFLASAQLLGVPAALAIASTYPLWSAFAGWAFLGQSVGPAGLLGVVLVVAGVVTVVRRAAAEAADGEGPGGGFRAPSGHTTGVLLAAATSLFWALNTFAIARGGADLPVAGVNTFRMGFAIALMPLARLLVRGPRKRASSSRPPRCAAPGPSFSSRAWAGRPSSSSA